MADYLHKPMELKLLGQVLRHWTSGAGTPGAPVTAATGAAQPPDAAPWIDPERLATLAEFDDAAGSVRREIVAEFLSTLDARAQALTQAMQQRDFDAQFEAAHLLKGACDNVGAARLSRLCADVERNARDRRPPLSAVGDLAAAVEGTRNALASRG